MNPHQDIPKQLKLQKNQVKEQKLHAKKNEKIHDE